MPLSVIKRVDADLSTKDLDENVLKLLYNTRVNYFIANNPKLLCCAIKYSNSIEFTGGLSATVACKGTFYFIL